MRNVIQCALMILLLMLLSACSSSWRQPVLTYWRKHFIVPTPMYSKPIKPKATLHGWVLKKNHQKTKSTLFLLHNVSGKMIQVNRYNAHPSASAGWMSDLNGDLYSLLHLSSGPFNLVCFKKQLDQWRAIDCNKVLRLYQVMAKHTKPHSINQGNFWMIENVVLTKEYQRIISDNYHLLTKASTSL